MGHVVLMPCPAKGYARRRSQILHLAVGPWDCGLNLNETVQSVSVISVLYMRCCGNLPSTRCP